MKQLIFASHNRHKCLELAQILKDTNIDVRSLAEIGYNEDIKETGSTLEANALIKARTIFDLYKAPVISEDTGLEIDGLGGEPGVITARYAGPERDANANMGLVLKKLKGNPNRTARFRTIIALIFEDQEILFEGICNGTISEAKLGEKGFGYDPIFIPRGHTKSFAQLSDNVKNTISHRAKALNLLIDYLSDSKSINL